MRIVKYLAILILSAGVLLAQPGAYMAGNSAPLYAGNTLQVWNAEQPTAGTGTVSASQQVQLISSGGQSGTPYHAHGFFASAPGAFEIDVQASDDDVDTHYQTISNGAVTSVDATNNTWHLDCGSCSARYVRLLMRIRTNAVNASAWIGR